MIHKIAKLSQRDHDTLQFHLGTRRPSGALAARALGREFTALGLSTLQLARIHEQALIALAPTHDFARTRNGLIRRAGNFFTAALLPLESVQRSARESLDHLLQRTETLRLHSAALAKGNRQLKQEVARRKAGEAAIRKGKEHYHRLFTQSQFMQKKLRHLARQVLSA
jgi:hypothetical protein